MCSPATFDGSLLDSFTDSQNNHQWPVAEFLNRKKPQETVHVQTDLDINECPKIKIY